MRKSIVTWRLSFQSLPSAAQLDHVRELLAPIAKVELAPNYGVTFREIGLSEHAFVAEPCELTPGELALACLGRAHRLAKGWSVMWPHSRGNPDKGRLAEEVYQAAMPEYLDGFTGMFSTTHPGAEALVTGLEAAGFVVRCVPEPLSQPEVVSHARPPSPLVAPATGPEATALVQSLLKLLVTYRSFSWTWEVDAARQQIRELGWLQQSDEGDVSRYVGRDGMVVDLWREGGSIRAISFVLREWNDPHLLDESGFARVQDACEALFSAAVASAKALLGSPAFAGASGESGFPKDQQAEFAALWPQAGSRILLEVKHDDRELPLQLCLVFAP